MVLEYHILVGMPCKFRRNQLYWMSLKIAMSTLCIRTVQCQYGLIFLSHIKKGHPFLAISFKEMIGRLLFVSYQSSANQEWVSSTCNYGDDFIASIERGNVHAVQFHPEKSGG